MAISISFGPRSSVANRKKPSPAVRNRSPTDATLLRYGTGIGITSANGPRCRKKSGAEPEASGTCSTVEIGRWKPEARYAGSQTGIRPSFTRMTTALLRIPMNASARPG